LCCTPQTQAPERNTLAQLIIKYYFLGKIEFVPKKFFPQFLVNPEVLLGDKAQRKEDLTILPDNVVLES
jgi:hypothetical protein